jgi:hypothetical protein
MAEKIPPFQIVNKRAGGWSQPLLIILCDPCQEIVQCTKIAHLHAFSPAAISHGTSRSFAIASVSAEKEINEGAGELLPPGCGTRAIGLFPHPGKMLASGSRF